MRWLTAYVADVLKDTQHPELQPCAVLAWSVTTFQMVLDNAGTFLTEDEAARALEAGELYIRIYMHLACRSLAAAKPRYYVRPKLHSLACETLSRLRCNSRFNPRYVSCWTDEDFVGKVCSVSKGSVHPTTLSLRILQRSLLYLNSWLATL